VEPLRQSQWFRLHPGVLAGQIDGDSVRRILESVSKSQLRRGITAGLMNKCVITVMFRMDCPDIEGFLIIGSSRGSSSTSGNVHCSAMSRTGGNNTDGPS
jgi:hypothetical protein